MVGRWGVVGRGGWGEIPLGVVCEWRRRWAGEVVVVLVAVVVDSVWVEVAYCTVRGSR